MNNNLLQIEKNKLRRNKKNHQQLQALKKLKENKTKMFQKSQNNHKISLNSNKTIKTKKEKT